MHFSKTKYMEASHFDTTNDYFLGMESNKKSNDSLISFISSTVNQPTFPSPPSSITPNTPGPPHPTQSQSFNSFSHESLNSFTVTLPGEVIFDKSECYGSFDKKSPAPARLPKNPSKFPIFYTSDFIGLNADGFSNLFKILMFIDSSEYRKLSHIVGWQLSSVTKKHALCLNTEKQSLCGGFVPDITIEAF